MDTRKEDVWHCELCLRPYSLPLESGRWLRLPKGVPPMVLLIVPVFLMSVSVLDPGTISWSTMLQLYCLAYGLLTGRANDWVVWPLTLFFVMFWCVQLHTDLGSFFMAYGEPVAELRPGVALCFAGESASAGLFAKSIVLITEYNYTQGAVGYIVNKPHSDVNAVKSLFASEANLVEMPRLRIGFGGPVHTHRNDGWEVVHWGSMSATVNGARPSGIDGVRVGGVQAQIYARLVKDNIQAEAQSPDASLAMSFSALAVRGFAGWAPAQLDGEVRRGSWTLHTVTAEQLLGGHVDSQWNGQHLWQQVCSSPQATARASKSDVVEEDRKSIDSDNMLHQRAQ